MQPNDYPETSALENLRTKIESGSLQGRDLVFAKSLLDQSRQGLSVKQWYWVRQLSSSSSAPATLTATSGLSRLQALFDTAQANGLKYPALTLTSRDGLKVIIKRAGDKSRYTGQLLLTAGRYGAGYYGRIDGDKLIPSNDMTDGVRELITEIAADPEKTAAAYGHKTGVCCFCNTELTDERSVAVGYGPICAKRFGLQWGAQKTATVIPLVDEQEAR